jgi:hypothetical protein
MQHTEKHVARACPSPTVTATNYECAFKSDPFAIGKCCWVLQVGREESDATLLFFGPKLKAFLHFHLLSVCPACSGPQLCGRPYIGIDQPTFACEQLGIPLETRLVGDFPYLFRVAPCRSPVTSLVDSHRTAQSSFTIKKICKLGHHPSALPLDLNM